MKIGKINQLKVLRKTDIGYILEKNGDEVFLHQNETDNKILNDGDVVDAFLYYDFKNRVAATLETPTLTLNQRAWLEVIDSNNRIGVFVNIGIQKDLLVSKDDLPLNINYWPVKGDKLYIEMILKNRLLGKLLSPLDLKEDATYTLKERARVKAHVVNINKNGLFVLTDDLQPVFVHHTQVRRTYRIGEAVDVNIIRAYEHTVNGSLIFQKEKMIDIDADMILNYLKEHQELPLTSDSSPEDIKRYFKMSKKAFKRAVGSLYKRDLIKINVKNIVLIGDKNE